AAKSWSGVAGIAGQYPVGGVLVSQGTEEVKDDERPVDRGTRHCRCVIECRRDAGRRGALVRKHQYRHRKVRGLPAQCFGRESWFLKCDPPLGRPPAKPARAEKAGRPVLMSIFCHGCIGAGLLAIGSALAADIARSYIKRMRV